MAVILHAYEDRLIRDLPLLKAQHVAENLLSRYSVVELLELQLSGEVDDYAMSQNKLPYDLWPEIVRAALLARISYFDPSPNLNKEKILLLVKLAVEAIGFTVSTPLPQVVAAIKSDYLRLTNWLIQMAQLLAKLNAEERAQLAAQATPASDEVTKEASATADKQVAASV